MVGDEVGNISKATANPTPSWPLSSTSPLMTTTAGDEVLLSFTTPNWDNPARAVLYVP